jgi:hypothetical protein
MGKNLFFINKNSFILKTFFIVFLYSAGYNEAELWDSKAISGQYIMR